MSISTEILTWGVGAILWAYIVITCMSALLKTKLSKLFLTTERYKNTCELVAK